MIQGNYGAGVVVTKNISSATTTMDAVPAGAERILVIEDDRAVQKALKRLFEAEGFAVDIAGNGAAGLEMFRTTAPSVLLLDLSLPLPPETNWSHAAYVASYGRIELYKYLKTVGAGAMIYCDTDSVIFDCPTEVIPFETGTELGQMRLEAWISRCEVYAPKVYQADARYVAKGIPKRLAKDFIEREKVEFDTPFRYREAISYYDAKDKRGLARWPNTHRLSVWRKVHRKLFRNYDRKQLTGNRFSPCKVIEKS